MERPGQVEVQVAASGKRATALQVAGDATGSRRVADRDTGLHRMEQAGATLTGTEAALFELLGRAGTDEFKRVQRLVLDYAPNRDQAGALS